MSGTVLVGDLRTGQITEELPVTEARWGLVLDDAGDISGVTLPGEQVRRLAARQLTAPARTFLAVETEDRIWQAGPIWTRRWSWREQTLTLGAAGIWSLFDHRKVLPVLAAGQSAATATTTISGTDLGGIARDLVAQALTHAGGNLPVVLPARPSGSRQETFPGYALSWVGEQLRQLTRRESAAPNIRFTPRRQAGDPTRIEWVMRVGTEAAPQLVQTGDDWVFDTTVPRSPVAGIDVDEDATVMASRAWVTGDGIDKATPIATATDPFLVDLGWPLLEADERRNGQVLADLTAHASGLLARRARPVQGWRMTVRASAVRQVAVGDHCRVVLRGDPFLPDGEHRVRIAAISGDLSDDVVLTMAPTSAVL